MIPLTKPDPAVEPEYYLLPDDGGVPRLPYLFRATQEAGGETLECEVVVKAREAGFARYVVKAEEVELFRGDTPAGPWEEVCEHQYILQWQDRGGRWHSVPADQLANVHLSFTESESHVDVEVAGEVARPSGRFSLSTRYGVDLGRREFLAEDRFRCAGLTSSGVARPMRLVEKVIVAQDHPDLKQPAEEELELIRKSVSPMRVGALQVGWRRHTKRTGDMPQLKVRKPQRELLVTYHEDGVTEALDVDPHTVLDDSNANSVGYGRCIGRSALGETALIFSDYTTPRIRLAYTTAKPPTQTSDWSFVTLAGSGGLLTEGCGGSWPSIYWCSLCLDERCGWLHVAWSDITNKLCYSKCDVSGGIGVVATASNWRKADGTQGYDVLTSHFGEASGRGFVDHDSEGKPFVVYDGAGYQVMVTKWNGSQWTAAVAILGNLYLAAHSVTIDDKDVIWVFAHYYLANPHAIRGIHCAFDDAHVAANWSSPVIVIQDDTYGAQHVSCCTAGDGAPYVFGGETVSGVPGKCWFNWYNGTSWEQGTGSDSGLEKSTSGGSQFPPGGAGDAAGYAFFIYSYWAATDQRNSKDTFASESGSYGGDPADYEYNSLEHRQLSTDDKLYVASAECGDLYFSYLTTGSGSPWWAAKLCAGGGGTYLSNNQNAANGAMEGSRPSGTSCRRDLCELLTWKDQSFGASDSLSRRVGGTNLSSDVTSEYPAGQCPWDGEDKCNVPSVVPY